MNQSSWRKGGNCRHDAHPGDPSSTSRGFAGLCARSGNDRPLLDRRGRATRRGSPPAHLAAPPDAVEKQTPFLLVTRANHETGRSRRVLIAHRPKHASQRQDRGRKRKKLQGVRSCKIDISSLRTTASNAAQFTTCCPICCGQPEAKDVRTIVNFVMAVTARVAEPGTCSGPFSQIGGFEMGNEASPGLSIEDRKQIAGGLFFIDDTSVREPAFADQLQNVDNHIIEWTSRVRQRAATGAALLTFAGPCRS